MPIGHLYTFGYGKLRGSGDLAELLAGHPIDVILDIRAAPTGRNPLWRKPAVALTVGQAGFEYQHVQELGNPDFRSSQPAYRLIDEREGMAVLENLITQGRNVALMCVCQETAHCHRRLIVAKLRAHYPAVEVTELEVGKEPVTH